jgi:hypothetical protein
MHPAYRIHCEPRHQRLAYGNLSLKEAEVLLESAKATLMAEKGNQAQPDRNHLSDAGTLAAYSL